MTENTKKQMVAEGAEDTATAIKDTLEPKSGGGFNISSPTADRSDMTSNATTAFFKKKGYM